MSEGEIKRKLASVRRIAAIDPIEGADRIVCVTVDGWQLVTQKSNNFQPNDLVVYFELDSFLPVCEKFEFLRPSSFKSTKNLGDGFRIKTIKLKGQVSQGLILPLSEFVDILGADTVVYEGLDLTEALGVQKYEKPIPANLAGKVRGNFPSFIRKTDQERIQNCFRTIQNKHAGTIFEVTMKLDGSSCTIYKHDGRVGVCSRNLDLEETEDNLFWKVARESGLYDYLTNSEFLDSVALQGELMGPGVQGNREGFKEHRFYLFDIWDIKNQRYVGASERQKVFTGLHALGVNIYHAPYIEHVNVTEVFKDVKDVLKYAERKSINHPIAEGVVFKSVDGSVSFKAINNQFLLKEKDD